MTVIIVVAMAGGYTYRGQQDNILINRGTDPEGRTPCAHQYPSAAR